METKKKTKTTRTLRHAQKGGPWGGYWKGSQKLRLWQLRVHETALEVKKD